MTWVKPDSHPKASASASATGELVAAVAGKSIAVLQVFATTDADGGTIQFTDGTDPISEVHTLAAGAVIPFSGCPWFQTASGLPLEVEITGNVAIDVVYAVLS